MKKISVIFLLFLITNQTIFGNTISTEITSTYETITNIQNQLNAAAKSYFADKKDCSLTTPDTEQLKIYSTQLKSIETQLINLSKNTEEVRPNQKAVINSLLTIVTYLEYIIVQLNNIATTTDSYLEYNYHANIFKANALINQLIFYSKDVPLE